MRVMSDLHLEFSQFTLPEMVTDSETLLILAGDIQVGIRRSEWFETLSKFPKVIYILGNHEHYFQDIETNQKIIEHELYDLGLDNIEVVGNIPKVFEFDDLRIIAGTLWTDMNNNDLISKTLIRQGLYDYKVINKGLGLLTTDDTIEIFKNTVEFFDNELYKDFDGKTIIVTHHMPSEKTVSERFKDSFHLNGGFRSDLDWLIEKYQPDFWLFGHTHCPVSEFIGKTHLLANPRGYPQKPKTLEEFDNPRFENRSFYPELRITL